MKAKEANPTAPSATAGTIKFNLLLM